MRVSHANRTTTLYVFADTKTNKKPDNSGSHTFSDNQSNRWHKPKLLAKGLRNPGRPREMIVRSHCSLHCPAMAPPSVCSLRACEQCRRLPVQPSWVIISERADHGTGATTASEQVVANETLSCQLINRCQRTGQHCTNVHGSTRRDIHVCISSTFTQSVDCQVRDDVLQLHMQYDSILTRIPCVSLLAGPANGLLLRIEPAS